MDSGEQVTKIKDEHRNLMRVLHNALQEADTCAGYVLGAEVAGNENLADFFREVQRTHARVAERAEGMLVVRDDEPRLTNVRSNAIPTEGDPGDVSSGQDIFP